MEINANKTQKNEFIMFKNNLKRKKELITNLYKYDHRAVNFSKIKSGLDGEWKNSKR